MIKKKYFILFLIVFITSCSYQVCKDIAKNHDLGDVHSCRVEDAIINGDNITLFSIEFGDPHDCFAGCFYNYYIGVFENNKEFNLCYNNYNAGPSGIEGYPTSEKYNLEKKKRNIPDDYDSESLFELYHKYNHFDDRFIRSCILDQIDKQRFKNKSSCDSIDQKEFKQRCINKFKVPKEHQMYLDELSYLKSIEISNTTNNHTLCFSFNTSVKEDCFEKFATKFKDPSICSFIDHKNNVATCVKNQYYFGNYSVNEKINFCHSLNLTDKEIHLYDRDRCFKDFANFEGERIYCDYISIPLQVKECQSGVRMTKILKKT